jgi:hypothetical protein
MGKKKKSFFKVYKWESAVFGLKTVWMNCQNLQRKKNGPVQDLQCIRKRTFKIK